MTSDQHLEQYHEPEYVDKLAWVPLGEDVIPAAQLLEQRVIAIGKRYQSTDTPLIDKLLEQRLIDESYHSMALRIVNLFRLATTKQTYAAPQIFRGSFGSGNSDFCPMTVFMRITRPLSKKDLLWIHLICGTISRPYDLVTHHVMLLKHVLETVEENFANYSANSESDGGANYHDQVG